MSLFKNTGPKFVGATRLVQQLKVGESTVFVTDNLTNLQAAITGLRKRGVLPEDAEFNQTKVILVEPKSVESQMALIITRVK
ncbi:hypothetical protein [Endozoicomonas sp. ALC066]|uniref:hypothetical protein n=1 Tax=Endozoicomonas sp. ALC066 TaxID=3403078 RepID=UPI003BB59EBF